MTHKEMMKYEDVEKHKCCSRKETIDINDVNIDNLLVSNKWHVGGKIKYFVDYINYSNDIVKPLFIKQHILNGSIKRIEKVKHVSFMFNEKT